MADTPTSRNRLRKPESGQYANAWAPELNGDFGSDRLDEALDGFVSFTLSGSKTLTPTNYETDEARMRVVNITGGTGGTVTIASVEKWYWVRNGSTGNATFTCGGTTAIIPAGAVGVILCNGINCYAQNVDATASAASAAAALVSQLAAAVSATDSATSATASAASAAAAAVSASAAAGQWTQIGATQSPSGVASVTFSSIPTSFQDLRLEYLGLSPSANTPQLKIELSDNNGANWTGVQTISGAVAAASGGIYGSALMDNYLSAAGHVFSSGGDLSAANRSAGISTSLSVPWRIAAGINAIRLTWSGSENFDAGSVKLKGK